MPKKNYALFFIFVKLVIKTIIILRSTVSLAIFVVIKLCKTITRKFTEIKNKKQKKKKLTSHSSG